MCVHNRLLSFLKGDSNDVTLSLLRSIWFSVMLTSVLTPWCLQHKYTDGTDSLKSSVSGVSKVNTTRSYPPCFDTTPSIRIYLYSSDYFLVILLSSLQAYKSMNKPPRLGHHGVCGPEREERALTTSADRWKIFQPYSLMVP